MLLNRIEKGAYRAPREHKTTFAPAQNGGHAYPRKKRAEPRRHESRTNGVIDRQVRNDIGYGGREELADVGDVQATSIDQMKTVVECRIELA